MQQSYAHTDRKMERGREREISRERVRECDKMEAEREKQKRGRELYAPSRRPLQREGPHFAVHDLIAARKGTV